MQLQNFAAIFLTKIAKLQFLLNGARELQVGEIIMVFISIRSRNFYQRFSEHKSVNKKIPFLII